MDKKNDHVNDDEEYSLQQPESAASFTTVSTAAHRNIFEQINRRHIVLGIIFLFLIYGAYGLIKRFIHTSLTRSTQITKGVQRVAEKSNATDAVVNVKPADPTMVRLDHLAQGQIDIQSEIRSLDSKISAVQTSLLDLDTQIAQVDDQLQSLHATQELFIQKQMQAAKKIERKHRLPNTVYYVRAMIPGRVWFTTQDGSVLTLGVGDNLAGYGVIDTIDPDQGIVTLSSGAVIGYNPNDR